MSFQTLHKSAKFIVSEGTNNVDRIKKTDNLTHMLTIVSVTFVICQVSILTIGNPYFTHKHYQNVNTWNYSGRRPGRPITGIFIPRKVKWVVIESRYLYFISTDTSSNIHCIKNCERCYGLWSWSSSRHSRLHGHCRQHADVLQFGYKLRHLRDLRDRVSENTTGTDVFDKEYMTVSCTHVDKLQNKLSSF